MESTSYAFVSSSKNTERLMLLLQAIETVKQTPAYKNRLKALEFE
jgi:hypothetical protein